MNTEPSPRPWRFEFRPPRMEKPHSDHEKAHFVDANGRDVWLSRKNAELIVDAVNERAKFEAARMEFPDFRPVIIAAGQRDAAIAERDRLRDIVRRMADTLEHVSNEHRFDFYELVREARAAIGEEAK